MCVQAEAQQVERPQVRKVLGVGETPRETNVSGECRRDAHRGRQGLVHADLVGHSKTFRFYSSVIASR